MSETPSSADQHAQLDEDDDNEPLLKFNRLGNDLKKVLKDDPASCLTVHEKFLAIGTHSGKVLIFDHEGNKINSKVFKSHDITVNQISIDGPGEYLASCSDDGKTVIHGFVDEQHEMTISFERPVKAVAISPTFTKTSKQIITGDDKLLLTEQTSGLFGKSNKTTFLHGKEGFIKNIKWCASYIAWANDKGVKIYDMHLKEWISFIPFPGYQMKTRERPDLYKCSLCWKDSSTLLIGWGTQVKIGHIVKREGKPDTNLSVPKKEVIIVAMFETDYYIAGIAPSEGDDIVLLTYSESEVRETEDHRVLNPRPHVRLVTPALNHCDEKSNDALGLREYEKYRCNLYGLEWVPGEQTLFIVSPADVIVAKQRTQDDHVTWLLNHHKYEEAMSVCQREKKNVKLNSYQAIGHKYLDYLLTTHKFDEAASRLQSILGESQDAWETYFYKFHESGKVKTVARFLPLDTPRLSPAIYELVLYGYLQSSQIDNFLTLLKNWDSAMYDTPTVINAVIDYIKYPSRPMSNGDEETLYRSLAVLYSNQGDYDQALSVYLRLKHLDVFDFIRKHNLFKSIDTKITELMKFNSQETLNLLLVNIRYIPPATVVNQLDRHPEYQFKYLDQLHDKYPAECHRYHSKMVFLYAEHSRPKLLPFLKKADGYDQNVAMKFCEERGFTEEVVYLLSKMGNHRQALLLIIKELNDVQYAINHCKEHNYQSLWDELITYSLDKPEFVKGLLENIGTHVDPLVLIRRIDDNMKIPGLRDALVKILSDYNLQMSLREHCQKILTTDVYNLLSQRIELQKRGHRIAVDQKCEKCLQLIIPHDLRDLGSEVVLFYCHHAFHKFCIPDNLLESCNVCNAQRRGPFLPQH